MALPPSFKAALLPKFGAQHECLDRSLTALQPDEVAIRITATAINPVDWKIRDGKVPFIKDFPVVLGSDGAGEIIAFGSDISNFSIGERVFFQGIIGVNDSSTFQQCCKMPAALVGKTPSNIRDEEASGICVATLAVTVGFFDKSGAGLRPPPWVEGEAQAGKGRAIIILGGSSSVGQYAIQMARLSGFTKIVTNSSAAHVQSLKDLGAHVVLDRHEQSEPADFASAIGETPLAFVFDAISIKSTLTLGVEAIKATNTQNSYVIAVQAHVDAELQKLCQGEIKTSIRNIMGLGSRPDLRYLSEPLMKHLGGGQGYLANGLFRPNRTSVVPGGLEAIDKALDRNKQGVSGEKIIIRP